MAKKLTQKQEKFSQVYVETGNASEAYRQAYPKSKKWKETSLNVQAMKSLDHPKIAARIIALQAKLQKRHEYNVDAAVKELKDLTEKSVNLGQMGPAISAVKEKCKLMGLYEKHNDQQKDEVNIQVLDSNLQEMVDALKGA